MKKLDARNRFTKKRGGTTKPKKNGATYALLQQRLDDLCEQFELVPPDVAGRVAALEHLLREKQLVTRQDLVSARAFVRLQKA